MTTHILPIQERERIQSLDVLRGFALLGILTMNIGSFSMPNATYFDPTAWGSLEGLDGWIWKLTHLLADQKFMNIFSMLFGAGIILGWERSKAKGVSFGKTHYRRVGLLAVFGLLHAHLLWHGDILFWYGMCGMFVFLFRKSTPKKLIVWGLAFLAVGSLISLAGGLSVEFMSADELQSLNKDFKPSLEEREREVQIYQSDWMTQMEHRTNAARELEIASFLFWAFWRVSGLMLLGMALFKMDIFSAKRSRRFYLILIGIALAIGLPIVGYGMYTNISNDWESPNYFFLGLQFNYWASILVSLGWIGGIMLVCQAGLSRIMNSLAAVGRMAFTHYILQTVLATLIFYGHGLGYFGQISRTGQFGIMLGIWTLQIIISPIWLKYFRFGPLEWLWRSLVYMQKQPFVREVTVGS
jgi:uncharacterized protein